MASEKDLTMNIGLNFHQDRTIREIQTSLPWTIRYSRDYRANPQSHKDFAHALVHVTKALGHLMGLVDDMDHRREVADDPTLRERYGKYVADLVVCAVRAANVFPGGVLDLQTATQDRIEVKNKPEEPGYPMGAGKVVAGPTIRPVGAPFHEFHIVEAMRDDELLGGVPVPNEWHCGAIMEAVEAIYPEATGFRDRKNTPPPLMEMRLDPTCKEGSNHWEALASNGVRLGTFWASRLSALRQCNELYPGAHSIKEIP